LPAKSALSIKLTRLLYGKKLKHMRNTGANLQLKPSNGGWEVKWKGQKLTTTLPFPSPNSSNSPLWIIATGPSIRGLDLTQLKNETLIGLNGAISTCLENAITPTYYAITDRDFFENRMNLVEDAIKSGAHCFFSFNGIARICEQAPELLHLSKISLLETVNRYYMVPQLDESSLRKELAKQPKLVLPSQCNMKSGWSHDAALGVFTGNTIAYIACQLANTLKFKNAFILGMDLGSVKGMERSYEIGMDARPTTIDSDYETYILPAFRLLSKINPYTQFWNLSPTSKLPESVMPRKSFKIALKETKTFS
jgi:KDO transferase-3